MNLLSRRSVLAIAAVVDVALHSRSAPVAAKVLAERHKLPHRHLETLLQGLVHAKILKGVRGPRGGYELARAPPHHGRRDRADRDVAQHRRSGRSRRKLGAA
jgi:Rrf2 family protein